jgi:hypothetical protein
MSAALRLHGRRELARRLDLDALLVPTLIVIPGPLPRIEQKVRPAALCLLVEAVDTEGTLLYENAACFGVVERVVGDGISLEASAASVRAPRPRASRLSARRSARQCFPTSIVLPVRSFRM